LLFVVCCLLLFFHDKVVVSKPGFQTSRELWLAHEQVLEDLFTDERHGEQRLQNFVRNNVQGWVGTSDFSGINSVNDMRRLGRAGIMKRFGHPWNFKVVRTCDNDKNCQKVLRLRSKSEHKSQACVHSDVRDRWPAENKAKLQEMEPKGKLKKADPDSVKEFIRARKKQLDHLNKHKFQMFSCNATSKCSVHDADCRLFPTRQGMKDALAEDSEEEVDRPAKRRKVTVPYTAHDDDDEQAPLNDQDVPMMINFGTPPCNPWTPANNSPERYLASSEVDSMSYCVEREVLAKGRVEAASIIEEVVGWPGAEKLGCQLDGVAQYRDIVADSIETGVPNYRKRKFAVTNTQSMLVWIGPPTAAAVQEDYNRVFSHALTLTGDEYFCEEDDLVRCHQDALAKNRGRYLCLNDRLMTKDEVIDSLPHGSLKIYKELEDERENFQDYCGHYIGDLSQHPKGGKSQPGPHMPSSLSSSMFMSWKKGRLLHPYGHFAALGHHMFEATRYGMPLAVMRPVLDELNLSFSKVKGLAGRAIHIIPYLAWTLYVMSNTVRVDSGYSLATQIGRVATTDFEESEDEGEPGGKVMQAPGGPSP
jgi:hypothetical protein